MKVKHFFKSSFFTLAIVILLTITNSAVVNAATPTLTTDPLTTQLVGIEQTKLDTQNNVLISGDASALAKPSITMSAATVQQTNDVATVQIRRNKMLADHGQKYTSVISKLTPGKVDITGDVATITATENITYTLVDKLVQSPVTTKEEVKHVLHYSLQNGQWILTDDHVDNPFVPTTETAGMTKIAGSPISLDVHAKSTTNQERNKFANIPGTGLATAAVTHGTFNANSAVNYARNYWNSYNPAYRTYGNDCTNFVSQADNWSGWQHIGGWYDDANYWWYSNSPVVLWGGRSEARSWINVHYYYFFARNSARSYNASTLTDFRVGDTLQVDFGTPDGILDHNTIVTKNNGNGNIFLTYHSVNTLDISIWDFIARTPGANYYGTLNYSQY